jgi:hypothetical protein
MTWLIALERRERLPCGLQGMNAQGNSELEMLAREQERLLQ